MAFGNNKKSKIFSEINITPLTDIFLVLLIIMMVIAPSFQSMDQAVDVPQVDNGVNIEESKVTISVTADGTMYIEGNPVSADQLTDRLVAVRPEEKAEVVVKADKSVKSAKIMDIMNAAQNAEYQKLVVAGEPLNRKEQEKLQQQEQEQQQRAVNVPGEDE